MSQISSTTDSKSSKQTKLYYSIEPLESDQLVEYLFAWIQQMRMLDDEQIASPLVISRTFRRFARNLEFIHRNDFSDPSTTLGKVLELRIATLLNSLLIEEVILKKGVLDTKLKLDLLATETKDCFYDNLKNHILHERENTIPYTLALLCCPLLLIFLQEAFDLKPELFKQIENLDIYKNIDKVGKLKTSYRDFLKLYSDILCKF
jgi:hypothetical protein